MFARSLPAIYGRSFLVLLLLVVSAVRVAAEEETDEPIRLTIYPQAEPTPALKYRLLPEFIDRKPGNAAVYYGKVTAEQNAFFGSRGREIRDKIDDWATTPLAELLEQDASVNFDTVYLRQAARCDSCDWQLPIREGHYFEILLPEVQQTREFQRILAAEARIQIAHGKFDEAVETFRTGLALGRNVASGETIVNGLIGVAITHHMLDQVLEFVQQPGAPNLYWAVSMTPQPIVDMRDAVEAEVDAFALCYPEFRDWETKNRTPEEWAEVLYALCEYLVFFDEDDKLGRADELNLEIMESYPEAKQALLEEGGAAAEVEAMSKEQVLALYSLKLLHQFQHDVCKLFHLPYPIAIERMKVAMAQLDQLPVHLDLRKHGPSSAAISARTAIARNERRFAELRLIESLRIYAAANDGKLPAQLGDITEVPIPLDPVTGESFDYELIGETAFLRDHTGFKPSRNYEITMGKLDKP